MSKQTIRPTEEEIDFPVVELLTGRGFITGKSGSGKSNTTGVILEQLLEQNFPFLIVDTEGEYYGLKEEYEILHVGADDSCDVKIGKEHTGKIVNLALEQNLPIVLDVSGYLSDEDAKNIVGDVVKRLFDKEKKMKKPFLLVIEECHEYIPEQMKLDDCGQAIIKVAKRGRKRGLGVLGISQRPADVKKDFITQANYKIWHNLDWDTDLSVVRRVIGKDAVDIVKGLETGEALIDADFLDGLKKAKFKERETFHAGQTPDLSDFETPDLKSVSSDLVDELQQITNEKEEEKDRISELEEKLERKNKEIENLEERINDLKDHNSFAERFVSAIEHEVGDEEKEEITREIENAKRTSLNQEVLEKLDQILEHISNQNQRTVEREQEEHQVAEEDYVEQNILDSEEFIEELSRIASSSNASKKALISTVSYLENNEGTQKEIANFSGYSDTTAVSKAVKSLRDAGLIEKVGNRNRKGVYALADDAITQLDARTKSREKAEKLRKKL
ncbi:MAG: helicase HerA domain-containing protein [Candidatus Nanohaloarchaea archaeon]